MPLETMPVSSGFGLRAAPVDQPSRAGLAQWRGKVTPTGNAPFGNVPFGNAPLGNAPAGKPPGTKMAVKPRGGPPPQPSPSTNPATLVNVPTSAGREAGLQPPGGNKISNAFGGFGQRGAPVMMMHEGVDLAADLGTAIHAAGDGVIKGAELKGGYGNWIEIEHDGLQAPALPGKPDVKPATISTVYGHLSAFAAGIAPGTRVKQGDVIGYVGSTGRSTGPHLHFEILQNGHPTNPMISQMLRAEQLKGGELQRFKKVIAKDLSERQREAGSI